ncbi:hypothetical protein BDZ85DRAFT_33325 [Elsinoe ampelina]|uniref:Uncharacterized protein n=1 Tax=Elsinoe ampelina TaxID=302913 RepID=A0A6A6G3B8_9PEZI|nr:hypothetical protein BDZ85DRAFT_33325 [Elsinoe ampelina]
MSLSLTWPALALYHSPNCSGVAEFGKQSPDQFRTKQYSHWSLKVVETRAGAMNCVDQWAPGPSKTGRRHKYFRVCPDLNFSSHEQSDRDLHSGSSHDFPGFWRLRAGKSASKWAKDITSVGAFVVRATTGIDEAGQARRANSQEARDVLVRTKTSDMQVGREKDSACRAVISSLVKIVVAATDPQPRCTLAHRPCDVETSTIKLLLALDIIRRCRENSEDCA